MYSIFGSGIAVEVFEQGKTGTTEIIDDPQAQMIEHIIGLIADNGCGFEAELIDMKSERFSFSPVTSQVSKGRIHSKVEAIFGRFYL